MIDLDWFIASKKNHYFQSAYKKYELCIGI